MLFNTFRQHMSNADRHLSYIYSDLPKPTRVRQDPEAAASVTTKVTTPTAAAPIIADHRQDGGGSRARAACSVRLPIAVYVLSCVADCWRGRNDLIPLVMLFCLLFVTKSCPYCHPNDVPSWLFMETHITSLYKPSCFFWCATHYSAK
ncbi:hypothetical protein BC937DRAFT_89175 [Endogone sp. FLAS-F59071]|nr:hypothetical protein BC937DRAFT_89175 [Endogone sp. FLAS-F59071]|eukprot:RUS18077.1 hypothetical protein BC937DRAFT_89175 [Endogone sp. FLAS-F59071]